MNDIYQLGFNVLTQQQNEIQPSQQKTQKAHFFLPPLSPSSLRSQEITFPSITTPFPSIKATRDKPSQFLKVSHTSGCCGWKLHCAISLDLSECGSSIFLPPVSLPIFHF